MKRYCTHCYFYIGLEGFDAEAARLAANTKKNFEEVGI